MTNGEIIKLIPTLTTAAEIAKAYRAYAGNRTSGALLGIEFYGCINSGGRAKICFGEGGFLVGIEHRCAKEGKFFLRSERGKAFAYFARLCMKAVRFNIQAHAAIAEARAVLKYSANNDERFTAAQTIRDYLG